MDIIEGLKLYNAYRQAKAECEDFNIPQNLVSGFDLRLAEEKAKRAWHEWCDANATAILGKDVQGTEEKSMALVNKAIDDITRERYRQVYEKGFGPEHDDKYTKDQLIRAAICYLLRTFVPSMEDAILYSDPKDDFKRYSELIRFFWPGWAPSFLAKENRRETLVQAAALIAADIDRMDRENQGTDNVA